MSSLSRKDFLNLSFLSLLGVLLAGLMGCFNKIIPVNIIKDITTASTNDNTGTSKSESSKETQSQNETTSTSRE
ncbi:MAG: hypothetical protein ACYCXK_09635, partial [Candidatus Humimicrobiaceae bacterium]